MINLKAFIAVFLSVFSIASASFAGRSIARQLIPLTNQSYSLEKIVSGFVVVDNASGEVRRDVKVIPVYNSFRDRAESKYAVTAWNTFYILDNGLKAFDYNGSQLRLPSEITLLSMADIASVTPLHEEEDEISDLPQSLVLKLKDGTTYILHVNELSEANKIGSDFSIK